MRIFYIIVSDMVLPKLSQIYRQYPSSFFLLFCIKSDRHNYFWYHGRSIIHPLILKIAQIYNLSECLYTSTYKLVLFLITYCCLKLLSLHGCKVQQAFLELCKVSLYKLIFTLL